MWTACNRRLALQGRRQLSQLSISLPDLSEVETKFVREQVDIITKSSLNPQEIRHNFYGSKEDLFSRCNDELQAVFPEVNVVRKSDRRVTRNLSSPICTRRIAAGLKTFSVTDDDFKRHPTLAVHSLLTLPLDFHLQQLDDDITWTNVDLWKKHAKLRGSTATSLSHDLEDCLEKLGFPIHSCHVSLQQFKSLTFNEYLGASCLRFLKEHSVPVDSALLAKKISCPTAIADTKMLVRNFWIFQNIMKLDHMSKTQNFLGKLLKLSPLESLVILNSYYETLKVLEPGLQLEDFLHRFSYSGWKNITDPSLKFPVSLRIRLLQEIGFTPSEIVTILMGRVKNYSDTTALPYTSENYVPEMQQRLRILREDGIKIGVVDPVDMFNMMTRWQASLEQLGSIVEEQADGSLQGIQLAVTTRTVTAGNFSQDGNRTPYQHLPSIKYLANYFGLSNGDVKKLSEDCFQSPNVKVVSVSRIHQTVNFLRNYGFSKNQIRCGVHITFYPQDIIENCLNEMREMPQFQPWSEYSGRNNILQLCLFLIERDSDFSGSVLLEDYETENAASLSDAMFDELETKTAFCRESQDHCSSPGNRFLHPPKSMFQQSIRYFSTSCASNFKLDATKHVKKIQNPFQWLQVRADFAKLKQDWDRKLDYTEFLNGSKQAAATVTQLISNADWDGLRGLLLPKEYARLMNMVETNWPDVKRRSIALDVDDIKAAYMTRINQQPVAYHKYCDIDIYLVGEKFELSKKVISALNVRFYRDYTDGQLPNWTISRFEVDEHYVEEKNDK